MGSGGLAIPSVSDIIRVNRVQGLTLGAAATLALDQRRILLKPRVAFGAGLVTLVIIAALLARGGGAP